MYLYQRFTPIDYYRRCAFLYFKSFLIISIFILVSSVLSSHKPSRPSENKTTQETKEDDDEVEIIEADEAAVEEEEEEKDLLVEDFDGECCRTYPFNHSKILRYVIVIHSYTYSCTLVIVLLYIC